MLNVPFALLVESGLFLARGYIEAARMNFSNRQGERATSAVQR
jgi:hypothetical protein